MPTMSQVFPVKSNAARAAKRFNLTRADLLATPGGWQFAIPGQDAAPASQEGPATDLLPSTGMPSFAPEVAPAVAADEPEPTDEELHALYYPTTPAPEPVEPAAVEPIEPPAAAKAPKAVKAKRVKVAKVPKAVKAKRVKVAKAPRVKGATTRGTPEYDRVMAARRTAQGRRGVMIELVAMLKRKWHSADELLAHTGWQSSTLRGLLSLEKKKQGFELERRKVDGATQYRIAA